MRNLRRLLNQTWTFGGTDDGWTNSNVWDPGRDLFFSGGRVGTIETVGNDYESYARNLLKRSGTVAACIGVRALVFSEMRFLWQQRQGGRKVGDLFGTQALSLIEEPWPNGTMGELLMRMELDNSLAGNFFAVKYEDDKGVRLRRWHPGYVKILTGSDGNDNPWGSSAMPISYIYHVPGKEPEMWGTDAVVHFSPFPDPDAQWRGMSWLTPVIEEILGDVAAAKHKTSFFKRGASPGLAVTHAQARNAEQLKEYADFFEEEFEGLGNAYRTLHMGAGADLKIIGANLKQLDFSVTQGKGESRIAAASMIGAVMAQFSEGLQGSSLNAGNFDAARKRSETIFFRPHARIAAAALQRVLERPTDSRGRRIPGVELTPDTRDVAFFRDDALNEATIRQKDSFTWKTMIDAGFEPDSVTEWMMTGNPRVLVHTGLYSVQLQRPGTSDSQNRVTVPAAAVPAMLEAGWSVALPKAVVDDGGVPKALVAANNGEGVLK